jgi:hypothetical protein
MCLDKPCNQQCLGNQDEVPLQSWLSHYTPALEPVEKLESRCLFSAQFLLSRLIVLRTWQVAPGPTLLLLLSFGHSHLHPVSPEKGAGFPPLGSPNTHQVHCWVHC